MSSDGTEGDDSNEDTALSSSATPDKTSNFFVTKLNQNDILMGRGMPSIDNIGNVRFRELVGKRKKEYVKTTKRIMKDMIARDVVRTIEARSGRFLRKVESHAEARSLGVPSGSAAYVAVDERTVLLKVKQALRGKEREALDEEQKKPAPQQPQQEAQVDPGIVGQAVPTNSHGILSSAVTTPWQPQERRLEIGDILRLQQLQQTLLQQQQQQRQQQAVLSALLPSVNQDMAGLRLQSRDIASSASTMGSSEANLYGQTPSLSRESIALPETLFQGNPQRSTEPQQQPAGAADLEQVLASTLSSLYTNTNSSRQLHLTQQIVSTSSPNLSPRNAMISDLLERALSSGGAVRGQHTPRHSGEDGGKIDNARQLATSVARMNELNPSSDDEPRRKRNRDDEGTDSRTSEDSDSDKKPRAR